MSATDTPNTDPLTDVLASLKTFETHIQDATGIDPKAVILAKNLPHARDILHDLLINAGHDLTDWYMREGRIGRDPLKMRDCWQFFDADKRPRIAVYATKGGA